MAPWHDTGEAPTAVLAAAERVEAGRALELACGTGTIVLALATRGWVATGVDASGEAIESARRRADWVSGAMFLEGDPTRPSALGIEGPFDLLVDARCFDELAPDAREAYVGEVVGVVRPGGQAIVFGGRPPARWSWSRRTREPEISSSFGAAFELVAVEPDPARRGDAWFRLVRRPTTG